MTTRTIDTADVAKLIRRDLKAVFGKTVKFSVRSSRYSGGSSIDVSWTDGPTQKMVERIVKGYAGGGFDGMTDYKYHFDGFLDGERVRFGVDFVFVNRRHSDEILLRAARAEGFVIDTDNPERAINELSIDDMYRVRRNAEKRVDARIVELFAKNFDGPRAVPDVEQAEARRLAVYPSQERLSGLPDVRRYDNTEDAARAARAGNVVSIMDLVRKRQR